MLIKILEIQNQMIQSLLDQKKKYSALSNLEHFFSIKKLTGDFKEIDTTRTQILINSIRTKYNHLLRNSTAPDDLRDKKYQELIEILKVLPAPKANIFSEHDPSVPVSSTKINKLPPTC